MYGTWDWFLKDRDWGDFEDCGNIVKCTNVRAVYRKKVHRKFHFSPTDVLEAPVRCVYYGCRVTCANYTDVPQDLSPNVTTMYVPHKNCTVATLITLYYRKLFLSSKTDEEIFATLMTR